MEQETKICQNCKKDFLIEQEDLNFYQKMDVPTPTFCWLCRAQRRMAWRNENSLFKRKSDYSGKEIFSAFSPESKVKVYEKDIWLSDIWEPLDYGREYDFSRNFFEQYKDLLYAVPLKNLNIVNGVNSNYCNNFTDPKNCYLTFNGNYSEDSMYGNGLTYVKDCVDNSNCGKSEKCYECFWTTSCSNTIFSSQCENSFNLSFCRDCVGCHDCFLCVGLRNSEYSILNKAYSKEEYKEKIKEFDVSSYQNLQKIIKEAKNFWKKFPKKYIEGYQNTLVSGNYINSSRNVKDCFLIRNGENLRYCQYLQETPGCKDCYDYTAWGDANELAYECTACGIGTHFIKFCYNVQEDVHDIEYSYMCASSSYLFGCVSLRKKQYCIFNKQYGKDEYFEMIEKIKKHMNEVPYINKKGIVYKYGEFFPSEFSPFAYNETLAQEYLPMIKEQAEEEHFIWREPKERNYIATIRAQDLPDKIEDVKDNIASEVIECEHGGNCNHQCVMCFKITGEELKFYKKMRLPLPRICFKCRNSERLSQRTLLQVIKRKCDCGGLKSKNNLYQNTAIHIHNDKDCPNEFETNYTDSSDIIYCEDCYKKEIY